MTKLVDGFYLDNENNIKQTKFMRNTGKWFVTYTNCDTLDRCVADDAIEKTEEGMEFTDDYIRNMVPLRFYRTEGEARVEQLRRSVKS